MAKLLSRSGKLMRRGTKLISSPCSDCCFSDSSESSGDGTCPTCIMVSGTISIPACGDAGCDLAKNVTFKAKMTNTVLPPLCVGSETWSAANTAGGYADKFCVDDPDGTFRMVSANLGWNNVGTWTLTLGASYESPCGTVGITLVLQVFESGPPTNFPSGFSGVIPGATAQNLGFMCCTEDAGRCNPDTTPFEFTLPDITVDSVLTLNCTDFNCTSIDCCVAADCTDCGDTYTVTFSGYEICSGCSSGNDPEEFCYVFEPVTVTITRDSGSSDCFWSGFAERTIHTEGCDIPSEEFTEIVTVNIFCQNINRVCYWFFDNTGTFWPCGGSRKPTNQQCPTGTYPSSASLGGDAYCTETYTVTA